MNLANPQTSRSKIKEYMSNARNSIAAAEQAEKENNWKQAGRNWFDSVGALIVCASLLYKFPYSGEWGYFKSIEKMRIVWHEGWLESAFDAALLLHFNSNHDFQSNDQIQWRINICRRFVNFLITKIEQEFKHLQEHHLSPSPK